MDKTIERKFFKAFTKNGVVSKCIEYLRVVHNLPETKPNDAKQEESSCEFYIKQEYPKKILEYTDAFDFKGIIGLKDSPLMDEIKANLNGCLNEIEKIEYMYSLLAPFGEQGCNIAGVFNPTEQNDWTLYIRDQFRRMIGEGEWVLEKSVEECLSFYYKAMIVFANRLYAFLLLCGIDMMRLQEDMGIYLIEEPNNDLANKALGSDKIRQKYINALPTEPQQEQTTKGKVPSTPQIPSVLNNDRASMYFAKAVEAGLMNEKFEWLKTKFLLACFCKELSNELDLGKGCNSDGGKRLCWKPFEQLFNAKKGSLRASLNDIQKTGNNPIGIEIIDAIFEKK